MELINEILRRPLPETLYHYTTQDGLLGIVKNRQLWATQIQYLNDSQELALALRLARDQLTERGEICNDAEEQCELEEMLTDLAGIENVNICIFSFSEERDLLSQWRGYCGGGAGYSIGFEASTLIRPEWMNFRVMPCVYDNQEQNAIVREIIEYKLDLIRHEEDSSAWNSVKDRYHPWLHPADSLGIALLLFAPTIKHKEFSEEREWRLISRPLPYSKLDFRPGASMLIPYYKYRLDATKSLPQSSPAKIKEIVVGPCPHMQLALRAADSFLKAQGDEDFEINPSAIPYRSW